MSYAVRRACLRADGCVACVFLHVLGEEEGNGQTREAESSQICCFCSKKNLEKQNLGFSLLKKNRRKTF